MKAAFMLTVLLILLSLSLLLSYRTLMAFVRSDSARLWLSVLTGFVTFGGVIGAIVPLVLPLEQIWSISKYLIFPFPVPILIPGSLGAILGYLIHRHYRNRNALEL